MDGAPHSIPIKHHPLLPTARQCSFQFRQHHQIKLQPLRLMHHHHLHLRRRRRGNPGLLHLMNEIINPQPPARPLIKPHGHFRQLHQAHPLPPAARRGNLLNPPTQRHPESLTQNLPPYLPPHCPSIRQPFFPDIRRQTNNFPQRTPRHMKRPRRVIRMIRQPQQIQNRIHRPGVGKWSPPLSARRHPPLLQLKLKPCR